MFRNGIAGSASIFLTASFLLVGCGSNSSPVGPITPVKGKVTLKGQPVTSGSITFESDRTTHEARGDINSDGTFTLTTSKQDDGAEIGTHRVQLSRGSKAGKTAVPGKYFNYATSKVEVEVAPDKTDYAIDLK